jgi:uncharacterized membrane protein YdjX (TVP38/TMEM64 family)
MSVLALWVWGKVKGWLAVAGGALVVVAFAFLKGRSAGSAAVKAADAKAQAEAIANKRESDDAVDQMGASGVDAGLGKWMRDGDR